jgi:hypothetical protein
MEVPPRCGAAASGKISSRKKAAMRMQANKASDSCLPQCEHPNACRASSNRQRLPAGSP